MSDTEEQMDAAATEQMNFTRPSILKIARKAGVKSLAEDSYVVIDTLMMDRIEKFVRDGLLVNHVRKGKVLTADDVQEAMRQRGQFRASGDSLAFNKV